MTSTPRSRRSVVDEEAILGDLRSGEEQPDIDYEHFFGSAGLGLLSDAPSRDDDQDQAGTTDDGDDRIFRRGTDVEETRRTGPVRDDPPTGTRTQEWLQHPDRSPQAFSPSGFQEPPTSRGVSRAEGSQEGLDRVAGGSPRPNQTREVQNPGQLDGIEFQTRSDDEVAGGDLASIFSSTVGWGEAFPAGQDAVRHQLELEDRWDHGFAEEEFDEDREAARADAVDEEESRAIARGRASHAGRRARNIGGLEEYRTVLDGSDEGNEPAYVDIHTDSIPMDPTPSRDRHRDFNEDSDGRPLWVRMEESEPILQGIDDVLRHPGRTLGTRPSQAIPRIFDVPNVPPFPNITFNRNHGRTDPPENEGGDPEVVRRARDALASGRLAEVLPMSMAGLLDSPLGQETQDAEPLRSSNEFTPQWGGIQSGKEHIS